MAFIINDPLLGTPKIPVSASYSTVQPWTIGSYKFGENNVAYNMLAKADDPYLGGGTFQYVQNTTANVAGATISSITYSAVPTVNNQFLATVTTGSVHSLVPGAKVILTGVVPAAYNGTYVVSTTPSPATFTIPVTGVSSAATTVGTYSYGAIRPGVWVQLTPTIASGSALTTAVLWAGSSNTGRPLGVAATSLLVNEYGWVQVQGNAIANVDASPSVGAPIYATASLPGIASPTAATGRQVLNSIAVTATGATIGSGNDILTLPSGTTTSAQAVIYLNFPFCQGAIT